MYFEIYNFCLWEVEKKEYIEGERLEIAVGTSLSLSTDLEWLSLAPGNSCVSILRSPRKIPTLRK